MAFVADFNEEELNRALEAMGGAPAVDGGPGPATGGATSVGGGLPASGPAPEGGSGFVNLSRYFDANQGGATESAAKLIEPLKQDLTQVGDEAARAVPIPTAPPPPPAPDNRVDAQRQASEERYRQAYGDVPDPGASWGAGSLLQRRREAHAAQEKARADAMDARRTQNIEQGRSYLTDPNNLRAAMSKDGREPSAFDTYLTGAAMPQAYRGLFDYYGGAEAGASYGDGRSGGGYGRPAPLPAAPVTDSGGSSAAEVLDPDNRRPKNRWGGK